MNDKPKFPRAAALAVARELCLRLCDDCTRLDMAGSLRRRMSACRIASRGNGCSSFSPMSEPHPASESGSTVN